MKTQDKPIAWLQGEIKTPPFSKKTKSKAGLLLRRLQKGEILTMPHSRPMPIIGKACHELRLRDKDKTWRIINHISDDVIAILEVFSKKSKETPKYVIDNSIKSLKEFIS